MCLLYLPALPEEACKGHIILSLTHGSLVSIGKRCDAGFTDELKFQEVTIKIKGGIYIQVPIDRSNRLWKIPLTA